MIKFLYFTAFTKARIKSNHMKLYFSFLYKNLWLSKCFLLNFKSDDLCLCNYQCKRKHTLVCPDFLKTGACPRGARCKLHHRLRTKRSAINTSTTPAKKARTKDVSKRFEKQSTRFNHYQYK